MTKAAAIRFGWLGALVFVIAHFGFYDPDQMEARWAAGVGAALIVTAVAGWFAGPAPAGKPDKTKDVDGHEQRGLWFLSLALWPIIPFSVAWFLRGAGQVPAMLGVYAAAQFCVWYLIRQDRRLP